jgi:PPP family 3-phenylpropionic acid transporter
MKLPYWRLSGFYFFYFATLGAFLPFWSLYLKHAGFAAKEIGELTALMIATKIIAPNLWGYVADRTGKRLWLIRLAIGLSALLFAGFFYGNDYYWFAIVTISFSFFWNATLPQFEAATLLHLKNQAGQAYSRIRLWGSIGFILAVLGIGWFLDCFSIGYLPLIITSLLSLNAFVALITPEPKASQQAKQGMGIWQVLCRFEVIAFFLVYMFLQIAHGPYYVFYSVYLKQHAYTATATGLLWALGVCAEIVMFMLVSHLLRLFSLRRLLLVSLALTTWRWLIIAYQVDQLAWSIWAQCLHSASFGIAHVVAIQLLYQYFGEQHQGKGQALYASFSFGIGGMLGSLYSGYFWDQLGASQVFVIAALASGLALLIGFVGVGRKTGRI